MIDNSSTPSNRKPLTGSRFSGHSVRLFRHARRRSVRTVWMAVLTAALLALAAACGSGSPSTEAQTGEGGPPPASGTATPSSESKPSAENKSATREFTDDLGRKVQIPTAPKRVVVNDFSAEALAVGIKPIAAGNNDFKIVFTRDQMDGIEQIGDPPNTEKILEASPDLIVMSTVARDIYPAVVEQLEKVAPIIYISFDQDPIYGTFPKIADALGRPEEAKKWIQAYESEMKLAREQVQKAIGQETVTIFRVEKGRLRIYLNRNFAGYMLRTSLATQPPAAVAEELAKNKYGSAVAISMEKLPEYAGDHMFVIVRSEGDDQAAFKEIQDSAIWKNLPAVRNGKLYFIDTDKYYGVDITTIRETMREAAGILSSSGQR